MTWRKLTGILLSAVCLIALAAGFLNVRNADEPNKGAIIDKSVLNKSETTQNTTPLPSKMCEDMIRLLTESELEPDMIEGKQLIIVNAYGTQAELYCFEMDSENTKIISNLGFLALAQGDKQQARNYFTAVLEFDPKVH